MSKALAGLLYVSILFDYSCSYEVTDQASVYFSKFTTDLRFVNRQFRDSVPAQSLNNQNTAEFRSHIVYCSKSTTPQLT